MVIEFNAVCVCAASISESTTHERRTVAEFDVACLSAGFCCRGERGVVMAWVRDRAAGQLVPMAI
jgi:hypothetical protein